MRNRHDLRFIRFHGFLQRIYLLTQFIRDIINDKVQLFGNLFLMRIYNIRQLLICHSLSCLIRNQVHNYRFQNQRIVFIVHPIGFRLVIVVMVEAFILVYIQASLGIQVANGQESKAQTKHLAGMFDGIFIDFARFQDLDFFWADEDIDSVEKLLVFGGVIRPSMVYSYFDQSFFIDHDVFWSYISQKSLIPCHLLLSLQNSQQQIPYLLFCEAFFLPFSILSLQIQQDRIVRIMNFSTARISTILTILKAILKWQKQS